MTGAPATSGNRPRMALARCTSATNTISMAMMLSRSSSPTVVPLTMASIELAATGSTRTERSVVRTSRSSGTIIWPNITAAGAPSTEAMMKWPAASGMIGDKNCA